MIVEKNSAELLCLIIHGVLIKRYFFSLHKGRWKQSDLKKWITFNRVVKNVEYNEHEDNFKVVVKNCSEDRVMAPETFDMIFVASGKLNIRSIH